MLKKLDRKLNKVLTKGIFKSGKALENSGEKIKEAGEALENKGLNLQERAVEKDMNEEGGAYTL